MRGKNLRRNKLPAGKSLRIVRPESQRIRTAGKTNVNDNGGIALSLISLGIYYKNSGNAADSEVFRSVVIYRKKAGKNKAPLAILPAHKFLEVFTKGKVFAQ